MELIRTFFRRKKPTFFPHVSESVCILIETNFGTAKLVKSLWPTVVIVARIVRFVQSKNLSTGRRPGSRNRSEITKTISVVFFFFFTTRTTCARPRSIANSRLARADACTLMHNARKYAVDGIWNNNFFPGAKWNWLINKMYGTGGVFEEQADRVTRTSGRCAGRVELRVGL